MSGQRRRGAHVRPAVREIPSERHVRSRWSLPIFSFAASFGIVVASIVSPHPPASAATLPDELRTEAQTLALDDVDAPELGRDGYRVSTRPTVRTAPAAGVPDPGTAQAIAYEMVIARGWGENEYSCLVALWNRESHWNVYAYNPNSGAYGIPQALPGNKMASAGADWQTNPRTQIIWGLGYIQGRYGTPCGAWQMSQTRGWY